MHGSSATVVLIKIRVGLHDTMGSVRPRSDDKAVQYSLS
jgi:hypothetical protein